MLIFRLVVEELLNIEQFHYWKFNLKNIYIQGIVANFYYQCLFWEMLCVFFLNAIFLNFFAKILNPKKKKKKKKSKSCLLLLESPQWGRFLGGNFIIFRPKMKEILNLGKFHWKFILNFKTFFSQLGSIIRVMSMLGAIA